MSRPNSSPFKEVLSARLLIKTKQVLSVASACKEANLPVSSEHYTDIIIIVFQNLLPNILYHYPAHLHTFSRYKHTQTAPSELVILGVPPAIFTLPCYFNERRCDKSGQCFRFFSRRYLATRATTAPNLQTHPPLSLERGKDCGDLTIDTAEDRRKAVEVLEPSSTRRREKDAGACVTSVARGR